MGKEDSPMIKGYLHIDYKFVFSARAACQKMLPPPHPIEDLIKYVHHISRERLYLPHFVLSSTATKQYGMQAYTEFVVTFTQKDVFTERRKNVKNL